MKIVKETLFESTQDNIPGKISIEGFTEEIGFNGNYLEIISSWWSENRSRFHIHYFNFNTNEPILGCFLGEDIVACNKNIDPRMAAPDLYLYTLIHESRHADQYKKGFFSLNYFQPVIEGNEEKFITGYKRLERDANNFAIKSMKEMGFEFSDYLIDMLRNNEKAGKQVYEMMKKDIEKYQPNTFIGLLKAQIL